MPQVRTGDVILHVEVDGEGEPVTVVAHGLTNNRNELAALTPLLRGTKVRFDFRGHGRSTAPERGYAFDDFTGDLDAVARAYGATRAIGTSLGGAAIAGLLGADPTRFERCVWLLPAAPDLPVLFKERYREMAGQLDGKTSEEALTAIVSNPERVAEYVRTPWKLELDTPPVVIALSGLVLGGACEFACACDIRVATKQTFFSQPENLGLLTPAGMGWKMEACGPMGEGAQLDYRVRVGEERDVNVTVPVTQNEIDLIQAVQSGEDCSAKAKIVGTSGTPE